MANIDLMKVLRNEIVHMDLAGARFDKMVLNRAFDMGGGVVDHIGLIDKKNREVGGHIDGLWHQWNKMFDCREIVKPDRNVIKLKDVEGDWPYYKRMVKKPTPKKNTIANLKGFYKLPQATKQGLGYNHPAMKGFFRGRDCGGVLEDNFTSPGLLIPIASLKPKKDPYSPATRFAREERAKRSYRTKVKKILDRMLSGLNKPNNNRALTIAACWETIRLVNKNYAYTGLDIFTQRMKSLGYRVLGMGAWSYAFQGPDKWVYKVNCNYAAPDGWLPYAINIMANGGTANMPVIDNLEISGKTYCAKMELLEPIDKYNNVQFDFDFDSNKVWYFETSEISKIKSMFACSGDDAIALFELVHTTKNDTKADYDIHSGNLMNRVNADGSKTLVLTDPLSSSKYELPVWTGKLKSLKAA